MEDYVLNNVYPLLKPVDECWQPCDFLPDMGSPDYLDQIIELRKRSADLPDDFWVVVVGDMITEEALPTYMSMVNRLEMVGDTTGQDDTAWARWNREWTAEENRHGDVMNKYCWLAGKVDLRAVEKTIQRLIGAGQNPQCDNNPYLGYMFTSFQEKATRVSHGNTARRAKEAGDPVLAKMLGAIAADEARHEHAYQRIVDEVFRNDPDGAVLAFADLMRKSIVMPAHMMDDGAHQQETGRSLFSDFSSIAEATGTYTAADYADIMEHLIRRWKVEHITGLSSEAEAAQQYVCSLPPRIRKLAERAASRKAKVAPKMAPFSWVYDRPLQVVP